MARARWQEQPGGQGAIHTCSSRKPDRMRRPEEVLDMSSHRSSLGVTTLNLKASGHGQAPRTR
eukprot:13520456-Heterocapsa_arctica.AAC.1